MSLMLDALKRLEAKKEPSAPSTPADTSAAGEITASNSSWQQSAPSVESFLSEAAKDLEELNRTDQEELIKDHKTLSPSTSAENYVAEPVELQTPSKVKTVCDEIEKPVHYPVKLGESSSENEFNTKTESQLENPSELTSSIELTCQERLTDHETQPHFRELTDNILSQIAPEVATSLMFISVDKFNMLAEMLTTVAMILSEKKRSKLLLIDACFEEKSLSRGFDMLKPLGLSEILTGRTSWEDTIRATSTPYVSVLPAGRGHLPDHRKETPALAQLLEALKKQWQYILINSGSIYSPLADSLALTSDASFLQVWLGETSQEDAASALLKLQQAGGRILGCIAETLPPVRTR